MPTIDGIQIDAAASVAITGTAATTEALQFVAEVEFAAGTWSDISADAERLTHRIGRQSELDRAETGASTTTLDNANRSYDSTYTGSPYYPNVQPGKRLRHRATLNATAYDLFVGFVDPDEGWPQDWNLPMYQEVTVRANDGFAALAKAKIPAGTTFPEELSGARLNRLLDLIGWPAGDRDIDAGQELIQAAAAGDVDGIDALSHAFQVADTEPGFVFINGAGAFIFHDRHHRLLAPYTEPQATFSDDPSVGEFLYSRLTMRQSKIVNVWRVTRHGGIEQVAEDAPSIDAYGRFEAAATTLHATDAAARTMAQWRLSQTKDPHERFVEMLIEPLNDADVWAQVLAQALGDRLRIKRTPPGAAEQIVQEGHVEAITRDLFALEVGVPSVTLALSPGDITKYWLAGVAGFSEAGLTTKAAY